MPVVLFLFTQRPLGALPSVALGIALMVTHRFYARPFALARSGARCLWCGGASGAFALSVRDPLGVHEWSACTRSHADAVARVLAWASRHALFLRVGILGTLGLFLPALLLADRGRTGPLSPADAVALFRVGIASSVLPLALLAGREAPMDARELRSPFPIHIQALIGTNAVLWLFRVVGSAWLAAAALHVLARTPW